MDGRSVHVLRRMPLWASPPVYAAAAAAWLPRAGAHRGPWTSAATTPPPPLPGVYAISRHGRVLYVGSTDQLARRIRAHLGHGSDAPGACRFGPVRELQIRYSVEPRFGFWLAREYRLLARLRPPLNERIPYYRR